MRNREHLRVLIGLSAFSLALLSACGSPAAPAGEDAALPASPAASSAPSPGPTESSPSAAPATPAPPAITLADTVPDGAWNGPDKIIKVKGDVESWWDPAPKKGEVHEGEPWVFSSTCTETLCTGTITRSTDGDMPARDFTWDGKTLKITRDPFKGSWECETDGVPNGVNWKWKYTWTYKIKVKADADGRVTTINVDSTLSAGGDGKNNKKMCGSGVKSGSQTLRSEMTPVG